MVDNGGRTALVIGGASGIGWSSARALADEGYRIVLADLNGDGAAARVEELGAHHSAAAVDVTDEESVAALFDASGPLDVVVTTAGFSNVSLIVDMPVDQFRSVIDVCLTGSLIVAKYAGRHLVDNGALLWISSLNGRQPAAGMSAYCSAKAGLSMLTQVAAMELAARGIRVNAVSATVFEEAWDAYGSMFAGATPIPVAEAAQAYVEAIEGDATGQVLRVGY